MKNQFLKEVEQLLNRASNIDVLPIVVVNCIEEALLSDMDENISTENFILSILKASVRKQEALKTLLKD